MSGGFMGAMFGAQIVANHIDHAAWMQRHQLNQLHNQAAEVAVLRQRDAELVRQHNALAADYNKLDQWATDLAARHDQLLATNKKQTKEIADLKARLELVSAQLQMAYDLDKQLHPEAHYIDFMFRD